ncbi:MAG TPA: GrpB family protein [Candidatus Eisenbacteria bacterium]|nr:GrpB family protein [Candidatus Eisenbacteria bacterium]
MDLLDRPGHGAESLTTAMPETPERVREYVRHEPAFHAHDPAAALAAATLIEWILARAPFLRVEHVGSTAVPGCGGKGRIDLLVAYPEGRLDDAKRALAALGFQPQQSREPFPEERPMRVGSMEWHGRLFPVHAHVVAASSPEAAEMLRFRDLLRADASLQRAYEDEKRRILEEGVLDGLDYARRKGDFIRRALGVSSRPDPGESA